jgi:uncharacterized protein YukE
VRIDALSIVGAFPVGDPAVVRTRAAQLRGEAERLGALVSSLESRSSATRFEGPAADRFRHDVAHLVSRGRRDVDRLHALAEFLARSATRLESAQTDWRRRLRGVEAELAARARGHH